MASFDNFCPKILAPIMTLLATILFEFKKFNSQQYEHDINFYHDFEFLKSDVETKVKIQAGIFGQKLQKLAIVRYQTDYSRLFFSFFRTS